MEPRRVPETGNRAAPVNESDLSLQDWGKFFRVRSGISKVLSEKGVVSHCLGQLRGMAPSASVPSSCLLEDRGSWQPPI